MSNSQKTVPISQIRENPVALRSVNKKSEEFLGLVDSIKLVGILSPPTVRPMKDPETGQAYYSLVDGLHRLTGAIEAGLEEIPVHVITATDADALELQLMANVHKVETKNFEYSKQLTRILALNPTLTAAALSLKLGKSPTWVGGRLGLTKLLPDIGKLVDADSINLSNALVLAKLPAEEQPNFVDRAMTMAPAEFTPTVTARVKEIRDAARQGRAAAPEEFVPVPHVRKLGELKSAVEDVTPVIAIIKEQGLKTPAEIVKATIQWTLSLDPDTVAAAKAKADQVKAEEAAKKELRAKERADKKAAAAAAAQLAVQAAANA